MKGRYVFEYAVLNQTGEMSKRYEFECKFCNSLGAVFEPPLIRGAAALGHYDPRLTA